MHSLDIADAEIENLLGVAELPQEEPPTPPIASSPSTDYTTLAAIAVMMTKNADGNKNMTTKPGTPCGTRYGGFSIGSFLRSHTNAVSSSSIPKLYKKFADETMSV